MAKKPNYLHGKEFMSDDQNIVSVLEKHLDDTRGIVRWAISFAFVATILAIQGQDQIEILNLGITRKQASWVFSAVYFFLCLGVWENIKRIRFHLSNLPTSDFRKVFRNIASHPWLFNPFTHYIYNGKKVKYYGFTGLIICFWICLSCVSVLMPLEFWGSPLAKFLDEGWKGIESFKWLGKFAYYFAPIGILMLVGYLTLEEILNIFREAKERITSSRDSTLVNEFAQVETDAKKAYDTGIGIGGLVFLALMVSGVMFPVKPLKALLIAVIVIVPVALIILFGVFRKIRTQNVRANKEERNHAKTND